MRQITNRSKTILYRSTVTGCLFCAGFTLIVFWPQNLWSQNALAQLPGQAGANSPTVGATQDSSSDSPQQSSLSLGQGEELSLIHI